MMSHTVFWIKNSAVNAAGTSKQSLKCICFKQKPFQFMCRKSPRFVSTSYCYNKESKKYSSTVLLPATDFPRNPVKKRRRDNDMKVEKLANFSSLYSSQETKGDRELFVLHDGPPYSNGSLHIGHALNKILKDIMIRYKLMRGYKVDYRPGWDCHGLPIELKALEKMRKKEKSSIDWKSLSPIEIRRKALALAEEAIETQRNTFKLWGLLVDWNNIYVTKSPSYVAKELKLFGRLYEEGFIFQSYMPVIYSPSSRTTLAEAELEYKEDHESPSLYLGFQVTETSPEIKTALNIEENSKLYLTIWTTTPWTLPGNLAICVAPDKDYALVQVTIEGIDVKLFWLAENVEAMPNELQVSSYKILGKIKGALLSGIRYLNPLNRKTCRVLPASHVITGKGTGLVHTAPAHGKEDFVAAIAHNISTDFQLVDDLGRYNELAGRDLQGKDVLKEGNDAILNLIRTYEKKDRSLLLLQLGKILHSYPYDWRTKKPTLIRASKQWFFDVKRIKEQVLEALDKVTFHPEHCSTNLRRLVANRSYWCLSRQRSWGVPIPVFYDAQTQEPVISRNIIDHVADVLEKEGPDAWWTHPEEQLLPPEYVQRLKMEGRPLPHKGQDILDIWFDAGSSWHCVLDGRKSDLYIEGIDQLTGWFQSSLLISVAATGEAPYKKLFIHDFVVDEHLNKMSKSIGNVVDPVVIIEGGRNLAKDPVYGINVLRWWVASECPIKQIPLGEQTLRGYEKAMISLRSLFWFLLANLRDFDPRCMVNLQSLRPQDRYILSRLKTTLPKIWNFYESCLFEEAAKEAFKFMMEEFNHQYIENTKDILLCESENNLRRRSIQTTFHLSLPYLTYMIAPILPHLTEEIYLYYPHLEEFHPFRVGAKNPPSDWEEDPLLSERCQRCLEVKQDLNNRFRLDNRPSFRTLDISISANSSYFEALKLFQPSRKDSHSDLCEILEVSSVTLEESNDANGFKLSLSEAKGRKCLRCLKNCVQDENELCERCKNVIRPLKTSLNIH